MLISCWTSDAAHRQAGEKRDPLEPLPDPFTVPVMRRNGSTLASRCSRGIGQQGEGNVNYQTVAIQLFQEILQLPHQSGSNRKTASMLLADLRHPPDRPPSALLRLGDEIAVGEGVDEARAGADASRACWAGRQRATEARWPTSLLGSVSPASSLFMRSPASGISSAGAATEGDVEQIFNRPDPSVAPGRAR